MKRYPNRNQNVYRSIVFVLIYCMVLFPSLGTTDMGLPVQEGERETLTIQDKQNLVEEAVGLYEHGEYTKAQDSLEQAKTVFPENYAIPYYLGLIYLKQGKRSEAIAQWQQYVKMDPNSENALIIRKNITLLLRQEAQEFAKQAVAEEASLSSSPADDKTLAVTNFSNLGSENLGPLGKGIAAMIISDLSQVPDLQVVDRIKLQALLEEMQLGTTGLVDTQTAPRVGKLLKARHVTAGSLADPEKESLMIASAVVDADLKTNIGTQEAQGALKKFYELEKQIACQIIEDLGWSCDQVPTGFTKIHTKSMPALVYYSQGLEQFDQENYDQAREMFQRALDEDPQFDLAAEALFATPTLAMAYMGIAEMISGASASAPPSATAGTAVAGASTGGSVGTASTAAASTVGFAPMTGIVVGAVVLGGAAVAGGGSSDDGNGDGDNNTLSLTGDWRGTWVDTTGTSSAVVLSLTQSGSSVNGTVSIADPGGCLSQGNISGILSGNNFNLTITSGAENVTVSGAVDAVARTLNGTWYYSASALGCEESQGDFSTDLTTGGADINW